MYQCFRASCDVKGALGVSKRPAIADAKPEKKKRKTWDGTPEPLPEQVQRWIKNKWGIEDPPYWYYTTDYYGRIAMSIRSPKDTHRGWVLRNDGSSDPKALTFVEENEEGISWYKTHPHRPTILVEDMPSAVRASTYVNAVALLGTMIGPDRAVEIADFATRPIIVALDQDATALSFRWVNKYALLWGDVKILPLSKDIKDSTEDEVCQLLSFTNPAT